MVKQLRITFSNGETFEIPVLKIANLRGKQIADSNFGVQDIGEAPDPQWTKIYREQRNVALDDDAKLLEWIAEHITWQQVAGDAVVVPSIDSGVDKPTEWKENKKTIIDHA